MKNSLRIGRLASRFGLLALTLLLASVAVFGQGDAVTGKYEGTVKGADAAEGKVWLELKSEGGKITGRAMRDTTEMQITEGTLKDGTLSLAFSKDSVLTAKVDGDKLVGDWMAGAKKSTVELKKVPAVAAATPAAPDAAPASGSVDLNGNWDAVADANGQPVPFALTLKVDGDTVTGGSSSQLGDSVIKQGSWKDGKLVFQLEGQSGIISLSATVIEGKLSGEFDYAGQLQGKWVAVKKN